jgi:hypothetical protein
MSPELERAIDMRDIAKRDLLEAKENFAKYLKRHEDTLTTGTKRIQKLEEEFAAWEKLIEVMRNASR